MNLAGHHLGTFEPEPDPGLGIRCVSWHPSGTMLAVGGWDDKIHILNSLSWTAIVTFELSSRIPDGVKVWREPSGWQEATYGRGLVSYDRVSSPMSIQTKCAPPGGGLVQLDWNVKGTMLLARYENTPHAVHLYSFTSGADSFKPQLSSLLLHSRVITAVQWNPTRSGSLALCCASNALYTWSDEWVADVASGEEAEEMAECISVPAKTKFAAKDVRWGPEGKGIVLLDKDAYCCAFEVLEDDPERV